MSSIGKHRGRLVYLFVAQVLLLVLYPYFSAPQLTFALFRMFAASAFLAGIYAVSNRRANVIVALLLAIPAATLNTIATLSPKTHLALPALICTFLFLTFTLATLFFAVVRANDVTRDTIYGALSVYMLMANVWAVLYLLLETVQPGAFAIASQGAGHRIDWSDCLFYSFVTLTSTGYGDIIPRTAQARSLSILEAVSGMMYVAVLVARLVGIYSGTPARHDNQQQNPSIPEQRSAASARPA